jgi:hypothetical protein
MIKLENTQVYIYIDSTWTDVTSDVLTDVGLRWKWGMSSNSPNDRLADVGYLRFALSNVDKRYTPDSLTALSGWKKGVPVKLILTYDGIEYIRFRGAVDGIRIDGGTNSARRVHVTALDWLDYAAKYPLNAPAVEQDKTADYAIDAIVDLMPIAPQATDYDSGISTYPTIFDAGTIKTKAYSEFNKLALSEPGYVYLKKDKVNGETLVFESLDARNGLRSLSTYEKEVGGFLLLESGDYLLLETGDKLLLGNTTSTPFSIDDEFINIDARYGEKMVNHYTVSAYPKRIRDTSERVYELEKPLYFASGETKSFQVAYIDPVSKRVIAALAPDEEGNNTKVLLRFNGPEARVITDETGRTWTNPNSDIENYTLIKKFGNSAGYFDGSDSWLYTANSEDFDFGTRDFTIDWWEHRFNNTSGATTTKRDYGVTYSPFIIGRSDGTNLRIDMSSNGSSNDIANNRTLGALSLNTWVHYAVVRSGSTFYAFKDGVQTDTWTSSAALNTTTEVFSVGRNGSTYVTTMIDDFRVTMDLARWTSAFTPPTTEAQLTGAFLSAWTGSESTGTELTEEFVFTGDYRATGAFLEITNGSILGGYVTNLYLYSYPVESDSPLVATVESETSYNEYGYQLEDLQQVYQGDILTGKAEAERVVAVEKKPRTTLNKVTMNANRNDDMMRYFLSADVGMLVELAETQTAVDGHYYIQGIECEITKKEVIMFSWIVKPALLLSAGLSLMACEFRGGVTTDALVFDYNPLVSGENVTHRVFSAWVYFDQLHNGQIISLFSDDEGLTFYTSTDASFQYLLLYSKKTSNIGNWYSVSTVPIAEWAHVMVEFDHSVSSNDPVFYINGVASTSTEVYTPSGTLKTEIGVPIVIGNWKTATEDFTLPFDGKIKDVRIYDMDKNTYTAADLADGLYDEGAGGTGWTDGMVFQAPAVLTEEVTEYTDLTLTAETKMLDAYLTYVGTPSGSPIARAF